MPRERRRPTRAAYGSDYTHNLRWRYRPGHGEGSTTDPYLGGGSFGQGYGRAWATGPSSPRTPYDLEYRSRYRTRYHPGTAARDYGRAYPYFGSAAALEGAMGYPPEDALPDVVPPRRGEAGARRGESGTRRGESGSRRGRPSRRWYGEEYG